MSNMQIEIPLPFIKTTSWGGSHYIPAQFNLCKGEDVA